MSFMNFILGIAPFAMPVLLAAIVAFTIVAIVYARRGDRLSEEDGQLMQDLFHGFSEMERRIETLETLLLEREGKDN